MKIIPCFLIALALCACSSSSKRPIAEAPPPIVQPSSESTPLPLTVAAAPKQVEVQQAVKRVFKDAAVVDTNYNPHFLSGDFNGDGSQDLAVVLKPAKIEEMNQELTPWLVRQPRSSRIDYTRRVPIEKNETLLAVIHGHGANHWRDPEATQTFVLKDVVGNGLTVHSPEDFITANSGRKLPRPQGDLIGETVEGTSGYLYFAQATYSWYDPKTFKGTENASSVFHKPRPMK
ncbi:MAG TPA: hypothetical protein VKB02_12945 [Pyrinomonadaceae bacterium]|nr:hypothetical protein [Pyrinomonadaceae bacterium]